MFAGLILGKIGRWIAIALVVILISVGTILYIQRDARQDLLQDIQIEQLEVELEKQQEVKDKLNEIDNSLRTDDDRIRWLQARQRERGIEPPDRPD